MIRAIDHTSAIAETKSYRKELKLKPSVAEAIQQAAACVGVDMSTFMASHAYKAAQEVQAAQHQSLLSQDAFDAFAAAVDRPGRSNPALQRLFRQRDDLVADG
jgi:uncharacterized protein (DUF1778 family)